MCKHLRDPVYWRDVDGKWHAFQKAGHKYWISMCGAYDMQNLCGGAQTTRPRPELRCGRCDGLEMDLRGWEESGPTQEQ